YLLVDSWDPIFLKMNMGCYRTPWVDFILDSNNVCKTKDVTLLAPYSKNDCFL
ncbi:hypothetical protein L9F63_000360, partial [Diploptera punctata]